MFGGLLREQSFEELRLRHYELTANGQEQQAIREAKEFYYSAGQQIRTALSDLDGAVKYIVDGGNTHPNRIDVCRGTTQLGLLEKNTPDHGQRQPMNASRGSLFGQTLQNAQPSASGQASTLDKPSNPFAKNFDAQSTFGKPSQLSSSPSPAFGQQRNPFASPPNSQLSGPIVNNLGAGASMEISSVGPSVSTKASLFGRNTVTTANPFGSTGTLTPSTQPPKHSFTASPGFQASPTINEALLGSSTNAQRDAQGRLTYWKGNSVSYVDNRPYFRRPDGKWERIWFPEQPKLDKDEELPKSMYTNSLEEDYRYLQQHGMFRTGLMPELPPKKEWCSWNF